MIVFPRKHRRGTVTAESLAACVLLAVAVSAIAQLAVTIARDRAVRSQHETARREAANLMTQVFALPWEALDDQQVAELEITEAASRLKGIEKSILIDNVASDPPANFATRKITVRVSWGEAEGGSHAAELTAWRHVLVEDAP